MANSSKSSKSIFSANFVKVVLSTISDALQGTDMVTSRHIADQLISFGYHDEKPDDLRVLVLMIVRKSDKFATKTGRNGGIMSVSVMQEQAQRAAEKAAEKLVRLQKLHEERAEQIAKLQEVASKAS